MGGAILEGTVLYRYGRVRGCQVLLPPKRVVVICIVDSTFLEQVHYV